MSRRFGVCFACLLVVCALLPSAAFSSDHRDGQDINLDPAADIGDFYAFLNPLNANRLVLVMTVNPFSVPEANDTYHFSHDVRYVFKADINGDEKSDRYVIVRFSNPTLGPQQMEVWVSGVGYASGAVTQPSIQPFPNNPVIVSGLFGMRAFAGQRDDPCFFNRVGWQKIASATGTFNGTDDFAGYNVSAIVVEVPIDRFIGPAQTFSLWATTERREVTIRFSNLGVPEFSYGPWRQVDRAGHPGVTTMLLPKSYQTHFNMGLPKLDVTRFKEPMEDRLEALGVNPANVTFLTNLTLPDVLTIDRSQPIEYPNGRALNDDVMDLLMTYISNQFPVLDGVAANDRLFSNTFPYLAAPHQP